MCKIVVVNRENREYFSGYLEEMHSQRYDIYVKERGWAALENPLGLDIDEYDNVFATWLLALSNEGELLGAVRLVPTDCDTLLGDHFNHLATEIPVPSDPDIWEITRYYVKDKNLQAPDGHDIKRHLIVGMLEYALLNKVKALVVVSDTGFLRLLEMFKWPYELMGLPQKYEEGECVGIYIHLSETMVENHRTLTNFWNDSLTLHGETYFSRRNSNFIAEQSRSLMLFAKQNKDLIQPMTTLIRRLQSDDTQIAARAQMDLEALILGLADDEQSLTHERPPASQLALN